MEKNKPQTWRRYFYYKEVLSRLHKTLLQINKKVEGGRKLGKRRKKEWKGPQTYIYY